MSQRQRACTAYIAATLVLGCRGILGLEDKELAPADAGAVPLHCDTGFEDCNESSIDGCEAELARDGENCGRCGRSCAGRTCASGMCDPEVVVADDIHSNAYQLAQDDQRLYWADRRPVSAIRAVGKNDGRMATLCSTAPIEPSGCAVHGDWVYWLGLFGGEVERCPVSGGESTPLATAAPYINTVSVDDTGIYFANHDDDMGFIGRVPLYGGEVVELAAQPGSVLPVLDNTSVYWFAANWVWRVAKNGGQATALIGVSSLVLDFAIDDASVYFVTESGELRRVDKFAGAPSEVLATGLGSGPAVAVDASRLYWIDKDAGELLVADKQGKNPVVLADNIDPAMETVAGQLLLDATFVYWFGIGGWIYRTPK